jgi:hypothetical protein
MLIRKDQVFLEISNLDSQMKAIKDVYTSELSDERTFEEEAQRQLELLKNLPKFDQAMNAYCSAYRHSFAFFLYIGNMIAGSGASIPNSTESMTFGKAVGNMADFALKLPLVGAGIPDIDKCKPYDTGSMMLSLNLGLSFGFKVKGTDTDASIGVALEYKGGISVGDYRDFTTIAEFVLKGIGTVKIPAAVELSLQGELAKWTGGFVFQDQYHWAAWLAARWGRFYAKARACDIYLSERHLGSDYRPDAQALADIDRLAADYLRDNKDIRDIYSQIRQYLEYDVLRIEQKEFFKGGSLDFSPLKAKLGPGTANKPGLGLGGGVNFAKGKTHLFNHRNEKGRLVEYTGSYDTWEIGVHLDCAGYSVRVDYLYCNNDHRQLNNGHVFTISVSPIPPTEVWTKLANLFLNVFTAPPGTSIRQRVETFLFSTAKLAVSEVLKAFAKNYMFGLTKALQIGCGLSEGHEPSIWYYRTSLDFELKLETSIPAYYGIYIDAGASMTYNRTMDEVVSWSTVSYLLYLYTGLLNRLEMQHPPGEKTSGTLTDSLRPQALTGKKLWENYVDAHKHQLWHLFVTIGISADNGLVIKELKAAKAKEAAHHFISTCQRECAKGGMYTLSPLPEVMLKFATGLMPSLTGQLAATAVQQAMKAKNEIAFKLKDIETPYKSCLNAFQKWLEAEHTKLMEEEHAAYGKFMRVLKEPDPIFIAQDSDLSKHMGWAAGLAHAAGKGDGEATQLQQDTHKDLRVCLKCLGDVGNDYSQAKYLLSAAQVPQHYWVNDGDVSVCPICKKPLKAGVFTSHKHHCRICGGIFCDDCCSKYKVPEWIDSQQIRVCKSCRKIIATPWFKKMVDERHAPNLREQRAFKPIPQQPFRPAVPHQTVAVGHPVIADPGFMKTGAEGHAIHLQEQHAFKPMPQQHSRPVIPHQPLDAKPVKHDQPAHLGKEPGMPVTGSFHDKLPDQFGYVLTAGHQRLLKTNNRREVPVYPDGNCLFSSLITLGAFDNPPASSAKVLSFRRHLSQMLSDGHINIDDLSPDSPTKTIAQQLGISGNYYEEAGEYAPEIISRGLRVKLLIYNADGSTTPVGPRAEDWPTYHLIRFTTCFHDGHAENALHYHAAAPL